MYYEHATLELLVIEEIVSNALINVAFLRCHRSRVCEGREKMVRYNTFYFLIDTRATTTVIKQDILNVQKSKLICCCSSLSLQ